MERSEYSAICSKVQHWPALEDNIEPEGEPGPTWMLREGCSTRPCWMSWGTMRATTSMGMAKPTPVQVPVVENMAVFTPITLPAESSSGPLEQGQVSAVEASQSLGVLEQCRDWGRLRQAQQVHAACRQALGWQAWHMPHAARVMTMRRPGCMRSPHCP